MATSTGRDNGSQISESGTFSPSEVGSTGSTTSITGLETPDLGNRGVRIVFAGKSGAGKSSLINNILKLKEDIQLSLDSTTQTCSTKQIKQHGITIEVVDTPGLKDDMREQLKALSTHTQNNADLLVYCLSIGPGSKFIEDPAIMQSLQDVYGADIWKHCVVALTFGNLACDHIKSRTLTQPDQSVIKYKEFVKDCAARFKAQLKQLGVQDIDVKTIFEASEAREDTIIAIPAGYGDEDQVLPGIVRRRDEEGWKGRVFLEMLKKCRDNHKADLLQYRYGREVVQQIIKKQGGVHIMALGSGAAAALGAGLGAVAGAVWGPAGMSLGGVIGAAAGIVAGTIFGGITVAKKIKTKDLLPGNESSDTTEESETIF